MRERIAGRWGARLGAAVVLVAMVAAGLGVAAPPAGAIVLYRPVPVAGWSTNGEVRAVAIAGDTVYVGGSFTEVRGPGGSPVLARTNVAAFDRTTGAVRTGFRADTNGMVHALVADGGSLYIGGSFTTVGGVARSRVARVAGTTGAVATWRANANNHVYALALHGDRLYLGGAFSTAAGAPRTRVAAVSTTTGAAVPGFAPAPDATVHALAVSPEGSTVYVGGNFLTVSGLSVPYLAKVDSGGVVAPTRFQSLQNRVLDLDLSPDGATVFAAQGGVGNQATAYDTTSGNRRWAQWAEGDVQAVHYAAGHLYFGFHDAAGGDTTLKVLAADARTGVLDPTFRPSFDGFWGIWDIASDDRALVLGGDFGRVAGVATRGVAILPASSGPDLQPPTVPGAPSAAVTATRVDLSWTPSTDDVGVEGYRVLRDGVLVGFTTATTFVHAGVPDETVATYAVQAVDLSGRMSAPATLLVTTPRAVVAPGAVWRYQAFTAPPASWTSPGYDDGAWASGPMELGYGDGDEATVVPWGSDPANRPITTWFRRTVEIPDPQRVAALRARLVVDDGAIVRLNGVEVFRFNLPAGPVTDTTRALVAFGDPDERAVRAFTIDPTLLVAGSNVLSVEVHQAAPSSSDLSMRLEVDAPITDVPPDLDPPTSPSAVTATPAGPGSLVVGWAPSTDAVGVTGYEVRRSIAGAAETVAAVVAAAPFTDTALPAGATVTYRVVALDAAANRSAPSAPATAVVPVPPGDVTPPGAPQDLLAVPGGSTSLTLSWTAATDDVGVVRYEVRRAGTVVGSPTGTSFTDTGLPPATAQTYQVVAVDGSGNVSPPATVSGTTYPATTTVLTAEAPWRFLDTGVDPGAAWTAAGFDDSLWPSGAGQFGYGDGDEVTVVGFGPDPAQKHPVTWFRTTFTVTDPATITSLTLSVLRDDGAAVYLNGVEVHRSNLPVGPIGPTTRATANVDGAAERAWNTVTLPPAGLVAGTNTIAVSVHQQWAASSDLSFQLRLDVNR